MMEKFASVVELDLLEVTTVPSIGIRKEDEQSRVSP